jgi:Sigma-70 region 2
LATAEDVVQDCFERLHRRWHVIREPGRALAYARSSVLNGCRCTADLIRFLELAAPGDGG